MKHLKTIKVYYRVKLRDDNLSRLYNDENIDFINTYFFLTIPFQKIKVEDVETNYYGDVYRVTIYIKSKHKIKYILPICKLKILKNKKNIVKKFSFLFK